MVDNLFCVMDETDKPYKENEYQRTLRDDIELLEIVKKDKLELLPDSRLAQVAKQIGF